MGWQTQLPLSLGRLTQGVDFILYNLQGVMLPTHGEGVEHAPTLDGQLRCQRLAPLSCTDLNQEEGRRESVGSVEARAGPPTLEVPKAWEGAQRP